MTWSMWAAIARDPSNAATISASEMIGSERLHHGARPCGDLVLVGFGHAEHLGDHVERQRERELGDHVASAALGPSGSSIASTSCCTRGRSASIDRRA